MKLEEAEQLLIFYKKELKDAPCSVNHHLNVVGGLMLHLKNTQKAAIEIDPNNETLHALALIHDIGKARTYYVKKYNIWDQILKYPKTYDLRYKNPLVDHLIHTIAMISEYGYHLSEEELHALQFHHGGWSPFSKNANLTELAVKLHSADMIAMARELRGSK